MHFYEVLYASIKEELSFSKVYRLYSFFHVFCYTGLMMAREIGQN